MRSVVAVGLTSSDRRVLIAASGIQWRTRLFDTVPDVDDIAPTPDTMLIYDARALSDARCASLVERLDQRDCAPSVIIRTPLNSRLAVSICRFSERTRIHGLSVIGADSLVDYLEQANGHAGPHEASVEVFRFIAPEIPKQILELALAAAILGCRRTSVSEFARVCGIAVRTAEWRFSEAAYMSPAKLLAWSLCLNAAWRLDLTQSSIKSVARESGFGTTPAFSNFIKRLTGLTPRGLRESEGFDGLCDRFRTESRRSLGTVH